MNNLLFTFFVVVMTSFFCSAQPRPSIAACDMVVKEIGDKSIDQAKVISRNEIRINDMNSGDLYQLVLMRNAKNYSFIIRSLDNNCFNLNTNVTFYFRDGRKLTFQSHNKENCDGLLLVNMGGLYKNEDLYDVFTSSYVIGIRFSMSQGDEVRLKVETPHTELIQEIFGCLVQYFTEERK